MATGFITFAFDDFYPSGGESDIFGVYETQEEADAALPRAVDREKLSEDETMSADRFEMFFKDSYQIYDVGQRKTVAKYKRVKIDNDTHTLFPGDNG